MSELKSVDCLPTITAEERKFLHYNPNTQDVVDWVVGYALASIDEWNRRAQPEPAASADADYPCRSDGRCQYAIDHGAEGMGHCPRGKCAMADAAPSVAPKPVAWQERQEVERGVFGDWYTTNSGWSTLRPPEVLSGGIRYQFRPLYAHPPRAPLTDEHPYTYTSTQATNCAGCGEYKHTPLRIDAMGGYVCLTCIDKKLGTVLGEFGYPAPQAPLTEEQRRDLVKECGLDWQRGYMPLFEGDPTNRYAVLVEAVEAAHGIGGK